MVGVADWAWSTHATMSASQQQTLSSRGARVYTCTCVHCNAKEWEFPPLKVVPIHHPLFGVTGVKFHPNTTPQLFYGPFSGTTWVSQCQRELLDFMVQGEINRDRHTGLENAYSRPQNWQFWGILPPRWGAISMKANKGTSLGAKYHPYWVHIHTSIAAKYHP